MIDAQQARIKSEISSNVIESQAYHNLCHKFAKFLRAACAKGDYSLLLPAEKTEENNKRFVDELILNGYTVEANPLSYQIFWKNDDS